MYLIDTLGRSFLNGMDHLMSLAGFIAAGLAPSRLRGLLREPYRRQMLASQIIFGGLDALPLTLVLALALGIGLNAKLLSFIAPFTDDATALRILVDLLALEVAPLMAAFVIIGRSGTAMSVELGNMAHRRELEGLLLLGIDPLRLILAPRLVALAVTQLVLATIFALVSLVSGILLLALTESSAHFGLLTQLFSAFTPGALLFFIAKNLLFGLIITGSACLHGFSVGRLVTEVPQQTQRAVVRSLLVIFMLDALFAGLKP